MFTIFIILMAVFEYNNEVTNQFLNLNPSSLLNRYDRYMYLKIFIDDTNNLKNTYINSALNHNQKILNPNIPFF